MIAGLSYERRRLREQSLLWLPLERGASIMPEYHFAFARLRERAFIHLRVNFPDDGAAISHAVSLATLYPRARWVTIGCGDRIIAKAPLNFTEEAADVSRHIRDSETLIVKSRQLLDETASAEPSEQR